MKSLLRILPTTLLAAVALSAVAAEQEGGDGAPAKAVEPLPEEYSCIFCHADPERLPDDTPNLVVTEKELLGDVHWQKGLRCHDCHGGAPVLDDFVEHRHDPSFQSLVAPEAEGKGEDSDASEEAAPQDGDATHNYARQIPAFCGRCHSSIEYMRRYQPSPRTDQEAEYWTSGHGQHLKATNDPQVATCASCHNKPHGSRGDEEKHGIHAVDSLESPVYPTNVAETCATCHANREMMAGRTYNGQPIGHDQYEKWKQSVHGLALLKKGDLSAPTCNDCHGNHGAVPPEVDSVANACGACHGKVAKLFNETLMKHSFEAVGLPGCATCHSDHDIRSPSDEMLGMGDGATCAECHEKGRFGSNVNETASALKTDVDKLIAGADTAKLLRAELDRLKAEIDAAEAKVAQAERLGMEVSGPRFDLKKAFDALTNSRSLIHSFSKEQVEESLNEGLKITEQVTNEAEAAMQKHRFRRIWLAAALLPILVVIGLLVLFIRALPIPDKAGSKEDSDG